MKTVGGYATNPKSITAQWIGTAVGLVAAIGQFHPPTLVPLPYLDGARGQQPDRWYRGEAVSTVEFRCEPNPEPLSQRSGPAT